jgi:hypothetical protein
MTAILAVAYWGFTEQDGVWRWVAGLGAPTLVIAVWWLYVAPKARFDVPKPARFAIELVVWATATVALAAAGLDAYAITFAVVAAISGTLNYVWD